MGSFLSDLMQKNYSEQFGIVNVRVALEEMKKTGRDPVREFAVLLEDPAERRWRLAAADGIRTLASEGECDVDVAMVLLGTTRSLAEELGTDEYVKTINAVAGSSRSAPALLNFIQERLGKDPLSSEDRWLAFYSAGMLTQRRTVDIPAAIRNALAAAAEEESEPERRKGYEELVEILT